MSLNVFQAARRQAESFHAEQMGDLPPTFSESYWAAWRNGIDFEHSLANSKWLYETWQDRTAEFYRETGERLHNPELTINLNERELVQNQNRKTLDRVAASRPGFNVSRYTDEAVEKDADLVRAEARRAWRELHRRPQDMWNFTGDLLASAAAAMTEPISVFSLLLGGGAGGGVGRVALREAAIGAGAQTVVEVATYNDKRRAAPDFTAGEAVGNVVMTGVTAGAFAGGIATIRKAWRALRGRSDAPRAVRDAAEVLDREAEVIRTNPFARFEPVTARPDQVATAPAEAATPESVAARPDQVAAAPAEAATPELPTSRPKRRKREKAAAAAAPSESSTAPEASAAADEYPAPLPDAQIDQLDWLTQTFEIGYSTAHRLGIVRDVERGAFDEKTADELANELIQAGRVRGVEKSDLISVIRQTRAKLGIPSRSMAGISATVPGDETEFQAWKTRVRPKFAPPQQGPVSEPLPVAPEPAPAVIPTPTIEADAAHRAAAVAVAQQLDEGRPVELPPTAQAQASARIGKVFDADNRALTVQYEVVEMEDLITSHTDDFTLDPRFPPELQPRDRERASSQDQVISIASRLVPERLGISPSAAEGAPVVSLDGIVESGNGRTMALRRVYGPGFEEQAARYRQFLADSGFNVANMRRPVLIARRLTDLSHEERIAFTTSANRAQALQLSDTERALADARLLDADMLEQLQPGQLTNAVNRNFVRAFQGKLPVSERGGIVDAYGALSTGGERRIRAALMARAWGEPQLLVRILEATDNNIKAIGGALEDASGPWARMRDAMARGELAPGMDVTNHLLDAVRLVMRARDEGELVRNLAAQQGLFGDELSPLARAFLRALFRDEGLRRPAGRDSIATVLSDYAVEAMKNTGGARLFGDPFPAEDILTTALKSAGREDLFAAAAARTTSERTEELLTDPATDDAVLMEVERIRAAAVTGDARREAEAAAPREDAAEVEPTTGDQAYWDARLGPPHNPARADFFDDNYTIAGQLDEQGQPARFQYREMIEAVVERSRKNLARLENRLARTRETGFDPQIKDKERAAAAVRIPVLEDNIAELRAAIERETETAKRRLSIVDKDAPRQSRPDSIMIPVGERVDENGRRVTEYQDLDAAMDALDAEEAAARNLEACALGQPVDTPAAPAPAPNRKAGSKPKAKDGGKKTKRKGKASEEKAE